MRFNPFWRMFESITAKQYSRLIMGEKSWKILWQPLFEGKFGTHAAHVNAAWFWARIKVRTKQLGYFEGGFAHLADQLIGRLQHAGVTVRFNHSVQSISIKPTRIIITGTSPKSWTDTFDRLLLTTPSPILLKLLPQLPSSLKQTITDLKGLGAQTLILELKKPFFPDGTYWLNINQPGWPFLAVVEHTHFAPANRYGGKHLLYIGKYLDKTHPQFKQSKTQILNQYAPFLAKLNPDFGKHLSRSWLFSAPFAQPIVKINHSQHTPPSNFPFKASFGPLSNISILLTGAPIMRLNWGKK
jgi:protoporphyrinogen oxidase